MSSWNDSLLVGISLIDNQHHELINSMDKLLEACHRGKGCAEVEETLRFVVSYIKKHFHDEEELQSKYEYPDIVAHKKLHAGFVKTVIDLVQEFQSKGPSPELTGKVNRKLVEWFITHIRTEDHKLAAYIKRAVGS